MTDNLFRDIAAALAFGRRDLGPKPYAQTEEEKIKEGLAIERDREIKEGEDWDILAGRKPASVIHEVWLRPNDINAAIHAMALFRSPPTERAIIATSRWVRVANRGDCKVVEFLVPKQADEPPNIDSDRLLSQKNS